MKNPFVLCGLVDQITTVTCPNFYKACSKNFQAYFGCAWTSKMQLLSTKPQCSSFWAFCFNSRCSWSVADLSFVSNSYWESPTDTFCIFCRVQSAIQVNKLTTDVILRFLQSKRVFTLLFEILSCLCEIRNSKKLVQT